MMTDTKKKSDTKSDTKSKLKNARKRIKKLETELTTARGDFDSLNARLAALEKDAEEASERENRMSVALRTCMRKLGVQRPK